MWRLQILSLCLVGLQTEALFTPLLTTSERMKCTYGERGSLTATCYNASVSYFKNTPYRFDQLDETLRCANCSLKTVESDTFDISGNQIKNLDLQYSVIENLRPRSFVGLIFLQNLNLANNKITSVYPGTFIGVKKIVSVNLENNMITVLSDDGFLELHNLLRLNFRHNFVRTIQRKAFNGLESLEVLDLSYNSIIEMNNCLSNLTSLISLNLKYNQIITLTGQEFYNLTKLTLLDLSNNKLTSPIINILKPNTLRLLDLSHNNIQKIVPGSLSGLESLEDLDLSYNQITEIPQKTLMNLFTLRNFNVSYNKIKNFQTGLFSGLPQLRMLNCSKNSIEEIEVTGVFALHSLHTLDISYNNISDLDYVGLITRIPRIAYLNMQNNFLPCDLEKEMEQFFAEDNFKFILYGSDAGSIKCINMPVVKKNYKQIYEAAVLKSTSISGSRSVEIFLLVVACILTILVGILYYLQFRNQFSQFKYLPRMTTSTVNLVSDEIRTPDDSLRE